MARPKCYDPEDGYMYQLMFMGQGDREWEHLDYAETMSDKEYLINEYSLAYRGTGARLKAELLPMRYWNKEKEQADRTARRAARLQRRKAMQLSNLLVNKQGDISHA